MQCDISWKKHPAESTDNSSFPTFNRNKLNLFSIFFGGCLVFLWGDHRTNLETRLACPSCKKGDDSPSSGVINWDPSIGEVFTISSLNTI